MSDIVNRTLTIEKILDSTLEKAWEAWSDPEKIGKWWGPSGMDVLIQDHDFKPGGQWKYAMAMPNGADFISDGIYKTIMPYEKIVTSANFRPMTEDVELHVSLQAAGDKIQLTFSCIHPSEEYCKQQEAMGFYKGWGATFDRLALLLESTT